MNNLNDTDGLTDDNSMIDDNKFWMRLTKIRQGEMSIIEKYQNKLKKIEFAIFLIALFSVLSSQFEYEIYYYPNYYLNKPPTPDNYDDVSFRIVYTLLSCLMSNLYKIIII